MVESYLGLGSNLGDKAANIREALERLGSREGVRVESVSSFYVTEPVGYTDQPDFVNAVARVSTDLSPHALLEVVMAVERDMGRMRNLRWGPRVIDIDVLIYDDAIVDSPDLVIPHPRMTERAFVMAPLAEIAPSLRLPDGRTPSDILKTLTDQRVQKLSGED